MKDFKLSLIIFVFLFVLGVSVVLIPNGISALFPISLMIIGSSLIITRPKWFLYVTLTLWTLKGFIEIQGQFRVFGSYQFNLSGFLNAFIIFAGVIYYLKNRKQIFFNKLIITFFIYLAICGISLLYTEDFAQGIRFLIRISCPVAIFYIVYYEIRDNFDVLKLYLAILISSAVPLGMGLFQLITGTGYKDPVGFMRLQALFEHPNSFSFYLVILFLFAFTMLLKKHSGWKLYIFFGFNIIVALQLVYTYCRSAWVAGIVGCFLIIWRYRKQWKITTCFFLMFAVCICSISLIKGLTFSPKTSESIPDVKISMQRQEPENTLDRNSSIRWRLKAWLYLTKRGSVALLVGKGTGSSKLAMKDLYGYEIHPHNAFIRSLYETGIVGLGIFILFLFFLFSQGWHLWNKTKTAIDFQVVSIFAASIVAFSLIMLGDNIFEQHSSSLYYWAFFALANQLMEKVDQNEVH